LLFGFLVLLRQPLVVPPIWPCSKVKKLDVVVVVAAAAAVAVGAAAAGAEREPIFLARRKNGGAQNFRTRVDRRNRSCQQRNILNFTPGPQG
jgi:hypothetical protein